MTILIVFEFTYGSNVRIWIFIVVTLTIGNFKKNFNKFTFIIDGIIDSLFSETARQNMNNAQGSDLEIYGEYGAID